MLNKCNLKPIAHYTSHYMQHMSLINISSTLSYIISHLSLGNCLWSLCACFLTSMLVSLISSPSQNQTGRWNGDSKLSLGVSAFVSVCVCVCVVPCDVLVSHPISASVGQIPWIDSTTFTNIKQLLKMNEFMGHETTDLRRPLYNKV